MTLCTWAFDRDFAEKKNYGNEQCNLQFNPIYEQYFCNVWEAVRKFILSSKAYVMYIWFLNRKWGQMTPFELPHFKLYYHGGKGMAPGFWTRDLSIEEPSDLANWTGLKT